MVNKKLILSGILTVAFLYENSVFAVGGKTSQQRPDGSIEATCDICKSGPEAQACMEAVQKAKLHKKQHCQEEGRDSQACKDAVKHHHYCRSVSSPSHRIAEALLGGPIVEEAEASIDEVPGNSSKAGS